MLRIKKSLRALVSNPSSDGGTIKLLVGEILKHNLIQWEIMSNIIGFILGTSTGPGLLVKVSLPAGVPLWISRTVPVVILLLLNND